MMKYKVHPVAAIFPMLDESGEDFKRLVEDIRENGQHQPIVIDGDTILDGRNRLRACEVAGKKPWFQSWEVAGEGMEDRAAWIFGVNFNRRSLTPDQKVTLQARYSDIIAAEAAKRKRAGQSEGGKARASLDQKSGPSKRNVEEKQSRSTAGQVAKAAGTSRYKAEQALKLNKAEQSGQVPEGTTDKVARGEVKLSDAVKAIPQKGKKERKRAERIGKMPVGTMQAAKAMGNLDQIPDEDPEFESAMKMVADYIKQRRKSHEN